MAGGDKRFCEYPKLRLGPESCLQDDDYFKNSRAELAMTIMVWLKNTIGKKKL